MKKIKLLILAVLLVACFVLSACGGEKQPSGDNAAPAEKIKVKVATYVPVDDPAYARYVKFTEDVNAATNNAFEFTIYPSDQLGDWVTVFDELIRGNVELNFNCIPPTYDSRLDVIYVPFIAPTYEDVPTVFAADSYITKMTDEVCAKNNIKFLGWDFMGYTGMVSTKKPLPEDFMTPGVKKKIVMRNGSNTVLTNWSAGMGYTPVTIPWADVYSSLQTGVIDASMGPTANVAHMMFRDVAKTFIAGNIYTEMNGLSASKAFWDKLTPEQQVAFENAANNMLVAGIEESKVADAEAMQKLKDAGLDVVELTPEQRTAIVEYSKTIWDNSRDILTDELVDELIRLNTK